MFKRLKDKLAEEVKSSPQRIQQIAQAAQAAVTSASSSISDITNSELFSIGDNDGQQPRSTKAPSTISSQLNTFQEVALVTPLQSSTDTMDHSSASQDILDNQRQRRLSNSSFASDVSFRLPSYETPSMYHLQSDMEVSASEAEERGFSSGSVSLDRVTKEQLYAAYRRTQERYTKYRIQYGDLARHYKLLEKENAKARSVLVETQDKALRRISELREQCSLEQSAKAHLEKALRVEIEEKIMKIEALETKIKLIQNHSDISRNNDKNDDPCKLSEGEGDVQLINLSNDNEVKQKTDDSAEILALNNKLEKTEHLLNKYKDSLKASKEKNSQISTELQILTNELENKSNEIEQLKLSTEQLAEAEKKLEELRNINEELQNKINVYEFNKSREQSTLEIDYQKAQEEINELQRKIDIFSKREEEYAISLAENKLRIHKELESKETLIKTLKESLDVSKTEIQSLNIVINDYKKKFTSLEAERSKLMHNITELTSTKSKINELESQVEELSKKIHSLEQSKTKAEEAYKFLQLQMKQETAEKLAMIDRNVYLENRNTQLSEDNAKKSNQISKLESELQKRDTVINEQNVENFNKEELFEELAIWKDKYSKLESEIQEEREELIKLQSEIEKLLSNHEMLQTQNIEFRQLVSDLKKDNVYLQEKLVNNNKMKSNCIKLLSDVNHIKTLIKVLSNDTKSLQIINDQAFVSLVKQINFTLNNVLQSDSNTIENDLKMENTTLKEQIKTCTLKYETLSEELDLIRDENNNLKSALSELQLEKDSTDEEMKRITNEYETTKIQLNIEKETIDDLRLTLRALRLEKEAVDKEVRRITNEYETTIKQLNFEKESNENLNLTLGELRLEKDMIQNELKHVTNEYETNLKQLNIEKQNIENLRLSLNELQLGRGTMDEEVRRITSEHQTTIEQLNIQKETNENLNLTLSELQLEKKTIDDEVGRISNEFETVVKQLNTEKESNEDLQYKINDIENNFQNLQLAMEFEKKEKLESIETTNTLLKEKQSLLEKIETIENEMNSTSAELNNLRDNYRIVVEELNIVKLENEELLNQARTLDKKVEQVSTLQEENKILTLENMSLTSQAEIIANSLKKIELEVIDLRKINAEIVLKNDSLNNMIEQLKNDAHKVTVDRDSQTDITDINNEEENTKIISITQSAYTDKSNSGLPLELEGSSNTKCQQSVNSNDDLSNQYQSLKTEYDILKEDNRRFKSDIEGLQTYLTKISKENSILNDKLRELIATSGNSIDNIETSHDLFDLKKEVQFSKEKFDDLMRENNLLIEENLELKDQIKNQNYPLSDDKSYVNYSESNNLNYKEKYNNLLQVNSTIEKKLKDLEQINKSVDGNAIQMHEKNEKLKLVNEKLERRLDEALVSLRHLHSLQENTELEYLRNILYEYLTGTGMHSLTLAKVLSAIVKFDDTQTKLVLQKEKERQGFLRQLGII